jgi:hypothetical protein
MLSPSFLVSLFSTLYRSVADSNVLAHSHDEYVYHAEQAVQIFKACEEYGWQFSEDKLFLELSEQLLAQAIRADYAQQVEEWEKKTGKNI